MYLNAYRLSKIPGEKKSYQIVSPASADGPVPKTGWTQGQLSCLEREAKAEYTKCFRLQFDRPK